MRTPENTVGNGGSSFDGRRTAAPDGAAPDAPSHRSHPVRAPGPADRSAAPRRRYVRPALSRREVEVLRCWLLSDSKSEVSTKLHVAPGTIKSHLHRIRGKYEAVGRNAGTKASLVARALQDGILTIEEL